MCSWKQRFKETFQPCFYGVGGNQLIQMFSGDYKCEGFIVSLRHSSSQKNAALLKKMGEKNPQTQALFILLRETSLNVSLEHQNIFGKAPGPFNKGDFPVLPPF